VGSAIDVTDYQPIRDYCRSLKNRHTRETQKYKGDCCDRVFFKIVFPPTAGNDIKYVRGNDQLAIFLRV